MRQYRISPEQFRAHQANLREEAITKEVYRLKGRLNKNQRIIRLQGILLALTFLLCIYFWVH